MVIHLFRLLQLLASARSGAATERPDIGPNQLAIGPNGGLSDSSDSPGWLIWRVSVTDDAATAAAALVEASASHLGLPLHELVLADEHGRTVEPVEIFVNPRLASRVYYGRRRQEHWMWPAGSVVELPGNLPPDTLHEGQFASCPRKPYELEMLSKCEHSSTLQLIILLLWAQQSLFGAGLRECSACPTF